MDKLTREELAQRNGKDGTPTFVSVDGKIYDVSASRMWKNGSHMKAHSAGKDLSLELQAAPHGPEVLERFQQVATLSNPTEKEPSRFVEAPALIGKLLDNHPHPVSVHFPVALLIMAAAFSVLGLLFNIPLLDGAGFANVVAATLMTPFTIMTGLLSWRYNYGAVWTSIYRRKAALSALLLVLALAAVLLRGLTGAEMGDESTAYWVYLALLVLMAPLVMGIGYLGGKITFPS